jgi:hypothetical protein
VQLWAVDKNQSGQAKAEPKKRLLASETVCLADGDALLRLFGGGFGLHLHMEEAGMESGLNLEDYDAVASLQATMSFLDVAKDGTEDVRMAKVLMCTDYDNMRRRTTTNLEPLCQPTAWARTTCFRMTCCRRVSAPSSTA